ncbi:MAG: hypothetical protein JWQ07_128 [Ramlibacter sp.]|nr:hypothetical protein [Ramlibacter sp.]
MSCNDPILTTPQMFHLHSRDVMRTPLNVHEHFSYACKRLLFDGLVVRPENLLKRHTCENLDGNCQREPWHALTALDAGKLRATAKSKKACDLLLLECGTAAPRTKW